jgi:hypothetical protein
MASLSLEERVQNLEDANKKMEHELARTRAYNEILNLVHRMQWFHTAHLDAPKYECFAKQPDTRVYFGRQGYWEGPDAPERAGKAGSPPGGAPTEKPNYAGRMGFHLMANPIIEIAGDGKTAKGVWVASGMVAMKDRKTGKPTASWEWNRYGIDFTKEDGKWKIWHHHVFDLFGLGWDEKWEDQFVAKPMPAMKTDYPATPLDPAYSPDTELPYIPAPEPYETFDPKTMY